MFYHKCEYCNKIFSIEGAYSGALVECPNCKQLCDIYSKPPNNVFPHADSHLLKRFIYLLTIPSILLLPLIIVTIMYKFLSHLFYTLADGVIQDHFCTTGIILSRAPLIQAFFDITALIGLICGYFILLFHYMKKVQ